MSAAGDVSVSSGWLFLVVVVGGTKRTITTSAWNLATAAAWLPALGDLGETRSTRGAS